MYLIGLRSFARGEWPFFGVDVVWTRSRIPGALQGWVIRGPLEIWPVPEAPFVLLNVLSFAALAALAWYLTRRAPHVPRWLVWATLLTLPWTLNYSTHVLNSSYILPGAIVFFVGFLEASPTFRAGLLPTTWAWAAMGLGLTWVMQFHMSWVLMPPYVLFALVDVLRREPGRVIVALACLMAGAAVPGIFLIPTLLREGTSAGGLDRNVVFDPQGPDALLTIVARFLSFVAFETNRFLGVTNAERLLFLWRQPWVIPALAFATLIGFVQPVLMLLAWFTRGDGSRLWRQVRWLTAGTLVLVYFSFFFSVRGPVAHAYFVVMPIAAFYGVMCWEACVAGRSRAGIYTRVAVVTLVAGLLMHAALILDRLPLQSLYRDRDLVAAAIDVRNDRFLGDRRSSSEETVDPRPRPIDPVDDPDAYVAANPVTDLEIDTVSWAPVLGNRVSRFTMQIHNRGLPAYAEVRFATTYAGTGGRTLAEREHTTRDILQPGVHRIETIDGLVPEGATSATLRVVGAERCIPLPR